MVDNASQQHIILNFHNQKKKKKNCTARLNLDYYFFLCITYFFGNQQKLIIYENIFINSIYKQIKYGYVLFLSYIQPHYFIY
jgi:hypothetical protein